MPLRIIKMYGTLKCINVVRGRAGVCIYNSWRFAGHSKWQNIRHIKAEKDGQRSATFTKLRRQMEVAAREGKSADPRTNLQLLHVVEQAKKANMPVSTINDCLKNIKGLISGGGGSGGMLKLLEISGPSGSAFIVCLATENLQLVKSNINIILKKSKGAFSLGSILHLFECKSIIQTNFPTSSSLEDAVNVAIELEMEDVIETKDDDETCLQFTGAPLLINKLKMQLEDRKYSVHSAEVNYKPVMQVAVRNSDLESVNWLYTKLQDIPDIVNIYDNIAWPENS